MVVVAIIGILSAVAVPQFQKFQRKAKQAEARANLAAIYTAQKIFLVEANTYYTNLWTIGYEPEGSLIYDFNVNAGGSTVATLSAYNYAPYRKNEYTRTFNICGATYTAGLSQNCQALKAFTPIADWVVTQNTFKLGAKAELKGTTGGVNEDWWSIDHRKELVNIQNGAL